MTVKNASGIKWKIQENKIKFAPLIRREQRFGAVALSALKSERSIRTDCGCSSILPLGVIIEKEKMGNINHAWNALRATLQNNFSFYDIKEIVGLAGFDLASIAHLEQKAKGGASKGQLMTGIDRGLRALDEESFKRFIAVVAEEILRRRPDLRESLEDNLSRLGWTLSGNAVIPIKIFDTSVLPELPTEARHDLTKAAQRLRDGDLSGAISSACGALDAVASAIYSSAGLGDPTKASFQERCKRSFEARGVIPKMKQQLRELGWKEQEIKLFCKNFEGAMNQGAYVMQTLRSNMGDVHGTEPILKSLVFDCLKWAELMLRALKEE
ncbi:MAG: hypothetical protein LWW94_07055 [Candidatus Desulfofervidaceae bacterium]|nr:hypothetical protein [Candidatus Desulfofervidaceae bacterium]